MPRNLYTEAFDSGYYYDMAHHADPTDHGVPKRIKAPHPVTQPKDDNPYECPEKLNIEALFQPGASISYLIEEGDEKK